MLYQILFVVGMLCFILAQFVLWSWMRNQMKWQKKQDEFALKLASYIASDKADIIALKEAMSRETQAALQRKSAP